LKRLLEFKLDKYSTLLAYKATEKRREKQNLNPKTYPCEILDGLEREYLTTDLSA
jgi:hypothetical protein